MRFSVSVPVLSVRITVVAPSVSTADRRSISAFFRAMRHMPRASASVATIGSPSGIAAIASAIAASTMRKVSLPCASPIPPISAVRMSVTQTSWADSRTSFFSSGVDSGTASSTSREMRPSSVSMPVATTTPIPLPRMMFVPLKSIDARSETRASTSTGATVLATPVELARKRGLVDLQVRCLDQPEIRGDDVAGVEQDDVSRNQALGGNKTRAPIPAYPGRTGPEHPKGFDGANSLNFGYEPDKGIERQHTDDRAAFLPFSEVECEPGGDDEQRDDEALELMNENGKCTGSLPRANCVRPVVPQPPARLLFGKSGDDRNVERGQHVARGPPVRGVKQTFGYLGDRHWKIQWPWGISRSRLPDNERSEHVEGGRRPSLADNAMTPRRPDSTRRPERT